MTLKTILIELREIEGIIKLLETTKKQINTYYHMPTYNHIQAEIDRLDIERIKLGNELESDKYTDQQVRDAMEEIRVGGDI